MNEKTAKESQSERLNRILGDEWLDWQGEIAEREIKEGKRTFLFLSLVVLVCFILLAFLLWYLILPRFQLYGEPWALLLTCTIAALAAFLFLWYLLTFIAVISKKGYLNLCLRRGTNLLIVLLPFVMKLAKTFGISRDRLGHSFIKVNNMLVRAASGDGHVLVLLPRCLKKDLKKKMKEICAEFPDVILHTAPGGSVARKIINETGPRAIIAAACERDLISGIQDMAPKIPVLGIPNSRPSGPCKDTTIKLDEFESALKFFCGSP